jgi:hypothetical protein
MLGRLLRSVGCAAMLSVCATAAHADQRFNLIGVTLATPGGTAAGTLTGYFVTNDALSSVISFDINASQSGSFAGFTYNPSTASVTAAVLPSQFFQLDSFSASNELRLFFNSPLTQNGTTLSPLNSYEFETSGGSRLLTGSVVNANATSGAVPEPASWAMMILGMGAVGYALRRKVRASEVKFNARIKGIAAGEIVA